MDYIYCVNLSEEAYDKLCKVRDSIQVSDSVVFQLEDLLSLIFNCVLTIDSGFTVNLSKDAYDRLRELFSLFCDVNGYVLSLDEFCSKIILNTSFKGILNEKTS